MARNTISPLVLVTALLPLLTIFLKKFAAADSIQNGSLRPEEAWSHLKLYGYVNQTVEKSLESTLKLYQQTYNLNVTGELDTETTNLITTPRCGLPDHNLINGSVSRRVQIDSQNHILFKLGVAKWPRTKHRLTYKINGGDPSKVGTYALANALRYSFQLWANVSKFTFQVVEPTAPADLLISFQTGEHSNTPDKDLWAHGVLAYANPPTDGRMHINAGIDWSFRPPGPKQFDLFWVVAHEIGHLLGIDHSAIPEAVMFAYLTPGKSRRALHPDDIAAIQAQYPN